MEENVKIAEALSDPIRYRIMLMLVRRDIQARIGVLPTCRGLCNCEITHELGLGQSRVSYHMKELTEAGLVIEEPRGRWKHYFINREAIQLFIKRLEEDFININNDFEGRS